MLDATTIHIVNKLERGISYAESCFETFRVIDGSIFMWNAHWQRLSQGLATFGMDTNLFNQEEIHAACVRAAKDVAPDYLLRLSITGGEAAWGLGATTKPQIYIQALPFQKKENVALTAVEYPFPLLAKPAKFTSDYALTLRAMQQWDTNTPLICKDTFIISGLTANIALFTDGEWLTPTGDGVLQGIIRQFFIDNDMMTASPCPTRMLGNTEAAVLLNSGSFIQVVSHIDHQPLDTNHSAIQELQHLLRNQGGVRL